jgi:UDP-N-acetylmuramate dehydrogenase
VHAVESNLGRLTTLQLGGPAQRVVEATDDQQIIQTVRDATRRDEAILLLAGGSNVVIADDGFDGTAIVIRTRGIEARVNGDSVRVRVAAGEPWDSVVEQSIREGWSGLEAMSGIPGSAGATPIQNVSAYGQEISERIVSVRVYDRESDSVYDMATPDCGFAYRLSVFKHSNRWVVLSVELELAVSTRSAPIRYAELAAALGVEAGDQVETEAVRDAVRKLRAGKGMVLDPADPDTYSVGSFFTNAVLDAHAYRLLEQRAEAVGVGRPAGHPAPDGSVKVSAAWLIERAGFHKGYGGTDVAISSKHTLALTNRGRGTTTALLALAKEIRDGVHERFGVLLHPEPVLVNCSLD